MVRLRRGYIPWGRYSARDRNFLEGFRSEARLRLHTCFACLNQAGKFKRSNSRYAGKWSGFDSHPAERTLKNVTAGLWSFL